MLEIDEWWGHFCKMTEKQKAAHERKALEALKRNEALEKQSIYYRETGTYMARCAVCGKPHFSAKLWYRSWEYTAMMLRFNFNLARCCNRWVCTDCFLLDIGEGWCKECADKKGIKGLTLAYSELARQERQKKAVV